MTVYLRCKTPECEVHVGHAQDPTNPGFSYCKRDLGNYTGYEYVAAKLERVDCGVCSRKVAKATAAA